MTDQPLYGADLDERIDHVVVSRDRISRRIAELGEEIAADYEGQELTIMAVLTGSLVFLADLVRCMPLVMRLDLVAISSYPGERTESAGPRFLLPISTNLRGRHVLVVDDILDSGLTLQAMLDAIGGMGPASLRTCVLLRKDRPDVEQRPEADHIGFDVANEFVVGYGLDFNGLYRNLPEICVLREHARGTG
jgi:hypoxanthine phosphoribosyltransferase